MFTVTERMQKILAANVGQLDIIDRILSGEDGNTPKPDADFTTCTITQAAKRLGISRPTVYRLVAAARLRTVALCGVRRVVVASLRDFVNGKGGAR